MDHISINDELLDFKKKARALNKEVIKIEKIGNANMAAFRVFYRDAGGAEVKENFFWRHDMDRLLKQFSEDMLDA